LLHLLKVLEPPANSARFIVDQIGFVEYDEIGAHKLILVNLFERIIVIERRVCQTLLGDPRGLIGETPLGDCSGAHHGNDAVDRELPAQSALPGHSL
jgi:hypothetical protein